MSTKRKWWQKIMDAIMPGWDVKPDPPVIVPDDPVTPPPADSFPSQYKLVNVHTTRDREWNISFHESGVVGEYDNKSRRNSRLVALGEPKRNLYDDDGNVDGETIQAPTRGYCAQEKGSKGAPKLVNGKWVAGHKTSRKISLCTALLNGRPVVFHGNQDEASFSAYDDPSTGQRIGELHQTGQVLAAVPYDGGLLCVLQGGKVPTVVTTDGREYALDAWCLSLSDTDRIIAGGDDGHVHELVRGAWTNATLMPLGKRVMSVAWQGPYIWATTQAGDVWCILSDGQARRMTAGEVNYGDRSWFGPRFGWHSGQLHVARKVKDGSSWRCVIERVEAR